MANKKMKTRLGIDIGANSIGWALIEVDGRGDFARIIGAGVRAFPDGRVAAKAKRALGASLNETRRLNRGERRRRDRYLRRRDTLMEELIDAGLMPAHKAERRRLQDFDPYKLRALAATDPAALNTLASQRIADPLHLIGRAIFHLHQRRGFNPNFRIAKKGGADDEGKIKNSIASVRQEMLNEGAKTFGQWLWTKRQDDLCAIVRARPTPKKSKDRDEPDKSENSDAPAFDRYPSREFIEHEFDAIWDAQKHRGGVFADGSKVREKIHRAIFHQRGLRPPIVGWCVYYNGNKTPYNPHGAHFRRAARALPSFQKFRILQIVNNLKFRGDDGEHLTLRADDENQNPDWGERIRRAREKIIADMMIQKTISFSALRKILKAKKHGGIIEGDTVFNFEDERTKDKQLDGSETGALFGGKNGALKKVWTNWDIAKRDRFVTLLLGAKDEKALRRILADDGHEWNLGKEGINACIAAYSKLAKGYAQMSGHAIRKLLAKMKDGTPYYEAASALFGAHTREHGPGDRSKLPSYPVALSPQFCQPRRKQDEKNTDSWRIPNPTVHIGLNQLRLVVNDIIRKHGKPDELTVELARDLNNQKQRNDLIARNERRRKENARLDGLIREQGETPTDGHRLLLRLWQEQGPPNNRRCVYCVAQKTKDGYPQRCIFCKPPPRKGEETIDDSPLTCIYCHGKNCGGKNIGIAALLSGEFEKDHILPQSQTFDDSQENLVIACHKCNRDKGDNTPFEWLGKAALACAERLPKNKRWRFGPDAMEEFQRRRGFMGDKLASTRYLGRIALRYFEEIAEKGQIKAVAGAMTARLRRHWKLNRILNEDGKNRKNRTDHRHHAIDALVIAIAGGGHNRRLHDQLVNAAKTAEEQKTDDFLAHLPEEPRPGFYAEAEKSIRRIIVSHKPDRKRQTGAFFEDFAYRAFVENGEKMLTRRVAVESLTPEQIFPEIAKRQKKNIFNLRVSKILRAAILGVTEDTLSQLDEEAIIGQLRSISSEDFKERLAEIAREKNIRRILLQEKGTGIGISNTHGKVYKTLKTAPNAILRIYRDPSNGKVTYEPVTFLDLAKGKCPPKPNLAIELRKHDTLRLETPTAKDLSKLGKLASEAGKPIIVVVRGISNSITVREHCFAGSPDKDKKKYELQIGTEFFLDRSPRKLRISPSGLVCIDEKSPKL